MGNLILQTDSYKLNHWNQYPKDTQKVYSYFEARKGAEYPYTVFFGLQYLIKKYLVGRVVTQGDLDQAAQLALCHFGRTGVFNYEGWEHIVRHHDGHLPLRIKAVAEGTKVPVNNVMMTVENTCDKCFWLTNAVESLLTHVWYPSTVATLSHNTIQMIGGFLDETGDSRDGLPFMLHDFGYRGATSDEAAAIGGAGHLVNSLGTDTLPAMELAMKYYDADLTDLAFSVPATEHSVMTSLGRQGEFKIVDQLLEEYPEGILSVVADSYDIYNFVDELGTTFKERILARDGKFVVRPDSITVQDSTPEDLVGTLLHKLGDYFGTTQNDKGFYLLNPKIGLLWGDGIDPEGIAKILVRAKNEGFSAENLVFGMGGGLLQKINRDTQRFAFKCSAQMRNSEWFDVCKEPLDATKTSKQGRLALRYHKSVGYFDTVALRSDSGDDSPFDLLQTVFENGMLVRNMSFAEVRENAKT